MASNWKAFDHQVAGHKGTIMETGDQGFLAKISNDIEDSFYKQANSTNSPLLPFMPQYKGSQTISNKPSPPTIIISNVVYGVPTPCIADIKIGTRLYGDDASEEKKARMLHQANTTTSGSTGLRICGMKLYDSIKDTFQVLDRSFGRALTSEQLVVGVLAYLRVIDVQAVVDQLPVVGLPELKALEYEKTAVLNIINRFVTLLTSLSDAIKASPVRLYGASVLLVYNGNSASTSTNDQLINVFLLDFAHSSFVDNVFDQGALFGVQNLIRLFEKAKSEI